MSLEPGQIVGQDLSPNANILGTQIADKTLLFRNFSENTFKIAGSGTATLVIDSPLTNTSRSTVNIAHGLSVTPAVIAYLSGNGTTYLSADTFYPLPYVDTFGGLSFSYTIDATNVTFYCYNNSGGSITGLGTVTFRYYLLLQTAN